MSTVSTPVTALRQSEAALAEQIDQVTYVVEKIGTGLPECLHRLGVAVLDAQKRLRQARADAEEFVGHLGAMIDAWTRDLIADLAPPLGAPAARPDTPPTLTRAEASTLEPPASAAPLPAVVLDDPEADLTTAETFMVSDPGFQAAAVELVAELEATPCILCHDRLADPHCDVPLCDVCAPINASRAAVQPDDPPFTRAGQAALDATADYHEEEARQRSAYLPVGPAPAPEPEPSGKRPRRKKR